MASGAPEFAKATPDFQFRAICPQCHARYGNPNPQGWIDVETCPPCAALGIRNQDYCHKVYRAKEKPEGWRDGRRKFPARSKRNIV